MKQNIKNPTLNKIKVEILPPQDEILVKSSHALYKIPTTKYIAIV